MSITIKETKCIVDMKIVHTKHFPFGSYTTINIFGVLFTKQDRLIPSTINHEKIHTEQMKEMGYIFFYLWYFIEYLLIRLFHKKQGNAYHDVSFEEEAYKNQYNYSYLKGRKHYAWIKFLKIRSYK